MTLSAPPQPVRFRKLRLGEILISRALITGAQLQSALEQQEASGRGLSVRFKIGGRSPNPPPRLVVSAEVSPRYAWSRRSKLCHLSDCRYLQSISSSNLSTGSTVPVGMELHACAKEAT